MEFKRGKLLLAAVLLIGATITAPAYAHRFNVALVMPLNGEEAETGRQYREGFMFATTERDSHANEESDGHLGGLDVYVSIIDANGDVGAEINRIVSEGEINIIATSVSEGSPALKTLNSLLSGKNIALLQSGQSPFSQSDNSAVAAFSSAIVTLYGAKPTAAAAQGYNAARRIDVAVREQGAADDTAALVENFAGTASGFSW